jgi:hypothetical protein
VDNDGIGDGITFGMEYKTLDLDIWMQTPEQYKAFFNTTEIINPIPVELTDKQKLDILWTEHLKR